MSPKPYELLVTVDREAIVREHADAVIAAARLMPEVRAVFSDEWIHPNMPEDDEAVIRSWRTLIGRGDDLAWAIRRVRENLNALAKAWMEGEKSADEALTEFFDDECMPDTGELYEWQKSRERMAWCAEHRHVEAFKEARSAG